MRLKSGIFFSLENFFFFLFGPCSSAGQRAVILATRMAPAAYKRMSGSGHAKPGRLKLLQSLCSDSASRAPTIDAHGMTPRLIVLCCVPALGGRPSSAYSHIGSKCFWRHKCEQAAINQPSQSSTVHSPQLAVMSPAWRVARLTGKSSRASLGDDSRDGTNTGVQAFALQTRPSMPHGP